MLRVSVFGLGYVGSVSAACLARAGHQVVGVDINEDKVEKISAGKSPIVEPGLEEVIAEVVKNGKLHVTTSCREAVRDSDIALVCVATPSQDNGQLDTSILEQVAKEIGAAVAAEDKPFSVVVRSTALPGTLEEVVHPALLEGAGDEFGQNISIGVNPEFIREGSALSDFDNPPFTLAGTDDSRVADQVKSLYSHVNGEFVQCEIRTAEMVKYVCNAYHALKICFANEIGDICESLGVQSQEVMNIFKKDRKLNISEAYLKPGFAFGGSCLPKDLRALVYTGAHADVSLPMMSSILPSNDGQIEAALRRVLATGKRRIGVLGLAFKPGTDDLRESPMVRLVERLLGKGCKIRIWDDNVHIAQITGTNKSYIEKEVPHVAMLMCGKPEYLLEHAEVLILGTHDEQSSRIVQAAHKDQEIIDLTRNLDAKQEEARRLAALS